MSGAWTLKSVWEQVYTRMKMLRCVTPVCGHVHVTGAHCTVSRCALCRVVSSAGSVVIYVGSRLVLPVASDK